ncbi:hypothetical protein J7399_16435 [Shimia sp. R9_1]|uniref:hypothetical protein n=1 Tax=unclassified Shimia TaxID=2630038 RepID=UPI001ADAAF10|nr:MULTISPECIES: hypothetical protein [unclassified Shimia]MBO9397785.1 hypothetical protein [Shimia sp. R9_2]MBO9402353.1 hypothetical protein [Shimia sp. R9_3]MBO9409025.1 hypothetical protein [Shimia sp. R9_1]
MVEAVGILGETTGWHGLSATQNAMLHAALAKYSGQAPQVPVESPKTEVVQPVQQAAQTQRPAHETQRNRAVDGAVMSAIRSAVSSYQNAQNGNFATILKDKLDAAGIDTSKSVVDYYT